MSRPSLRFAVAALLVVGGCSYTTNNFILGGADVPAAPDVVTAPDVVSAPDVVDAGTAPDVAKAPDVVSVPDVVSAPDVVATTDLPDVAPTDAATPLDGGDDVATVDAADAPAADVVDPDVADAAAADVPQVIFCAMVRPCPTGLVCDDGICETQCPAGQTPCNGFCRATMTDTTNCGGCGVACMPGQECRGGMCSTVCTAPTTNCMNVCRDLSSDNANCGMCGRACTGGTSCVMSNCACPSGQTACNTTCTNVTSDPMNCGACNTRCAAGQVCAAGACVVNCTAGLTNCSGTCRNLQTDVAACGRCDARCTAPTGGTVSCVNGACVQACPAGRTNCNGVCVDLNADRDNCGRCGTACAIRIGTCSSGTCCILGQTACSGACTLVSTDNNNCGRCGNRCGVGTNCRAGNCEANFRVASLGASNARVLEHFAVTNDDRGGIAANASFVFYSGDSSTGRWQALDLLGGTSAATPALDALVSNIRTGGIYALSTDGATPFRATFGATVTFTHLIELNASTLVATGARFVLSTPIANVPINFGAPNGVYAGYDRAVIYAGGRAYNVALPGGSVTAGVVTDLGAVALQTPFGCESWAHWGVAEYFSSAIWLVYRSAATGMNNAVVRTRVPDGFTQVVAGFTNLTDLCSFTVVPGRNRWYFHHEGLSQFGGSDESIGFADASFAFTN